MGGIERLREGEVGREEGGGGGEGRGRGEVGREEGGGGGDCTGEGRAVSSGEGSSRAMEGTPLGAKPTSGGSQDGATRVAANQSASTKTPCRDRTRCLMNSISLEAQQRYFSYREIRVAIVSQTLLCLFLWGIAQLSRDTLQNGVSHGCVCVRVSIRGGGVSHLFGGVLTSLKKYRAIWGIAAIVSQYRAIWGH